MSHAVANHFDVVVIGGGHAGVEAAWACCNLLEPLGLRTALITMDASKIGVMSCNPAIGGLAKGQLVREIDACGGLMGLATDATGIQFRLLNTSKGPAVHGPRAQCDKHRYARRVQAMLATRQGLAVIQGSVESLVTDRGSIRAVRIANAASTVAPGADGRSTYAAIGAPGPIELSCSAVVLTTGTFMRGLMHIGEVQREGGRAEEGAAVGISACLASLGFELGRLKTGTPPRLRRGTIDWESLEPQHGDVEPTPFSDLTATTDHDEAFPSLATFPVLSQVECRQTRTSEAIHALIRENLHLAPMYSGQIEGVGPRYCPSLEDKVVRFADRDSHGVFLEPESLEDDWIYCNGISTSLPARVQDAIVRAMPGCERAEILRHGYAVEYDMVRPHQLLAGGMTKRVAGLFLAGQINGTSGYEEAAAQGLVAGINAARLAAGSPPDFTFGRDQAYIGVMMDDLVTKTPLEPYRMFTSRAEHRLLLRADNAADRLTPLAGSLGLLSGPLGKRRLEMFRAKQSRMARLNDAIDRTSHEGRPLEKLLRADAFDVADLRRALPDEPFDRSAWQTVLADRRYETYVVRQRAEIRRQADMEHRRIPAGIDYLSLVNLRTEAKQALHRFRPETFGQASRLEGMTPADVSILAVVVRSRRDATPDA